MSLTIVCRKWKESTNFSSSVSSCVVMVTPILPPRMCVISSCSVRLSVLVSFCKDRARIRGNLRSPSLRTIEKEAYAWAERGIDTMEEAAAFIQRQNVRNSRMHRLMQILQIRGRSLTAAEERYAFGWLDMGFAEEVIGMAYERTCLNTGGLNWAYMHKILQRWHEAGLHNADAIQNGDRKMVPKGASGELGAAELEAIQRVLREG